MGGVTATRERLVTDMSKSTTLGQLCAALLLSCTMCFSATGCAGATDDAAVEEVVAEDAATEEAAAEEAAPIADGTYRIEVDTDSSMFHAYSCELTVENGTYTATLVLPGEGFSRLYYGTAEEAATADDADIYDYSLNDEGKYTFVLPVAALDEELTIAAFGHRRDKWYDHTITFHAPAEDGVAAAA